MTAISIGIIKEGKIPVDHRVPLTPEQVKEILTKHPNIHVKCQRSDIRCFKDEEYAAAGAHLVDDVSDCEIILGVKEVPLSMLSAGKTHFFFSHTIKKQEYNRGLLQEILKKNIRLIDWECLTNQNGQRLIAFGRYAGIVGAYNGILTFGKRYNLFHLRPAHECFDLDDMKTEYVKVNLPPVKIVVTGGGRVSKGAMEVLNGMGIRKVSPAEFVNEYFNGPVYTQLNTRDYNRRIGNGNFDRDEFYKDPSQYESAFLPYAQKADVIIAGAFWDPKAPVLFTKEDIVQSDFKVRVIADITCDIEGSIPSTKQPATIDNPVYDYNPSNDRVEAPYSDEGNITVMAVDNLPCELPRNASEDFGKEFLNHILPNLIGEDVDDIIKRASITENGKLTERYSYLQDYVNGN
ncbi:NAD(P)-dependent oxidoreductase [Roseivirga misakiensis]|uniref:Saccharopine dehydrogenase [NAD(+), L-lysine-forming] n=1 Tax=Roseivirga misakiensis TaxID=1563681 RepID=A0A1E5T3D4_9BACT|nr:NAD(P)-dependent oxidoreductase [Roseivirga misakiensis]OEK05898.1 alanine dehydrogenase [Roseivirga misakiensis]